MKTIQYRQGDVYLRRVDNIPDGLVLVPRDNGRIVLAYGEVTGHAHAILDNAATLFAPSDLDEMAARFLRVENEVALEHEEHSTIVLAPGIYEVRRQREYSPSALRNVAD